MKKTSILALILTIALFSCKDKKTPENPLSYMNMTAGSTWNYENTNNIAPGSTSNYTLTSTARDTVANGNSYRVFTNIATNESEYYRVSGSNYYRFQKLPSELGGSPVENLYLKTNVTTGTSWSQSYNITFSGVPLTVTLTNTITEKDINKTVNSIAYISVIHTTTTLSVSSIPSSSITTAINGYYAPNVGIIESTNKIAINYLSIVSNTDNTIRLKTSSLK